MAGVERSKLSMVAIRDSVDFCRHELGDAVAALPPLPARAVLVLRYSADPPKPRSRLLDLASPGRDREVIRPRAAPAFSSKGTFNNDQENARRPRSAGCTSCSTGNTGLSRPRRELPGRGGDDRRRRPRRVLSVWDMAAIGRMPRMAVGSPQSSRSGLAVVGLIGAGLWRLSAPPRGSSGPSGSDLPGGTRTDG